ncbi:MAG: 3-dehydroquinate synthase [Lachnospiraceae bacterium]|nr:3-dehydroquinate synthase [Lachnospiraceae bacterium]
MKRIPINAEQPYEVLMERGLLDRAGDLIRGRSTARWAAVVSDETVFALYGTRLLDSLRNEGFQAEPFIIPPGEASKNLDTYCRLLSFLADNRLQRNDPVIALGGGVVGDLAGFAAATYLRGLPFVQIPTTLLAVVDASVGGKTAVNLPEGKNLAGAFHQPAVVLCDPELLNTLPPEEIASGMGELIKTAFLSGEEFFRALETSADPLPGEDLLARAIETKAALVAEDERDFGARRLLNLGHSFGHAIEAFSGYTVPHGQAVAEGLLMITRAAVEHGLCDPALLPRLAALMERYGLEAERTYTAAELLPFLRQDKKLRGGHLPLIVPRAVGHCDIVPVPLADLASWLKSGGAL